MLLPWPGKRVLLIFLPALLLAAGLVFYFSSTKKQAPLNVVLLTDDALRANPLGCYGYKRNASVEKGVFAALRERLRAYADRHAHEKESFFALSEETRRSLKSLGYLQ